MCDMLLWYYRLECVKLVGVRCLAQSLRETLREWIPDDEHYTRVVDRFEYLLALERESRQVRGSRHFGEYAFRMVESPETSVAAQTKQEIEEHGDCWAPLKAGFFGGDLQQLNAVKCDYDEKVVGTVSR